MRGAVTGGSFFTHGGWSHSCERPTRRSPRSSAQTISVAEASSVTTRRGSSGASSGGRACERRPPTRPPAFGRRGSPTAPPASLPRNALHSRRKHAGGHIAERVHRALSRALTFGYLGAPSGAGIVRLARSFALPPTGPQPITLQPAWPVASGLPATRRAPSCQSGADDDLVPYRGRRPAETRHACPVRRAGPGPASR